MLLINSHNQAKASQGISAQAANLQVAKKATDVCVDMNNDINFVDI